VFVEPGQSLAVAVANHPVRFAYACGMHWVDAPAREWLAAKSIPLLVLDCGYFSRATGPNDETGYNQLGLSRLCWVPTGGVPAGRFDAHGLIVAPRRERPQHPVAL